jgi:integrase
MEKLCGVLMMKKTRLDGRKSFRAPAGIGIRCGIADGRCGVFRPLPRSDRSPRRRLRKAQREWGWLDAIPTLRLREESQRRVRWITQEEASRLLAELPEHVADMAEFSLSTGLRLANVTGLTWNQIDLGRRLVIL